MQDGEEEAQTAVPDRSGKSQAKIKLEALTIDTGKLKISASTSIRNNQPVQVTDSKRTSRRTYAQAASVANRVSTTLAGSNLKKVIG